MAIDKDRPVEPSFEQDETHYHDFLLEYPADGFTEARRRYMDSAPSEVTFASVLGALAITGEKRRVTEEIGDTRLDFGAIVEDLE
ncbi:hypothetical protein KC950_01915 [Candidatus Saccharibacteria bacterium]|nr:hypothetical protein [Candidatus Saccharibacteria bacterium]MCA9342751.1 hypothetical protein [Candidatus Saccharibacteria bacterium]